MVGFVILLSGGHNLWGMTVLFLVRGEEEEEEAMHWMTRYYW